MEDKMVPAVALGEVRGVTVPPVSMAIPVGQIHLLRYQIFDEEGGVMCTNR